MTTGIYYDASILPESGLGARVKRRVQSRAAQVLLDGLAPGIVPTAISKSHSRAAVAAAVGEASGLSLGIDVEWMNPDRPFTELAATILPARPPHLGSAEFYRLWTLAEAYFKAFARRPSAAFLLHFARHAGSDRIWQLDDGTAIRQLRAFGVFQVCVVAQAIRGPVRFVGSGRNLRHSDVNIPGFADHRPNPAPPCRAANQYA